MLPVIFVVACALFRIVPHPPNFAPVGATAVFSGRTMKPWSATICTIAAMFAGDVVLSVVRGYPLVTLVTPFVYAGFIAQAMLGRALRTRRGGAVLAALLGAGVFFLSSNLGVWLAGTMYSHDALGLFSCYVAALPFLAASCLGDVVWTMILSSLYRPLARRLAMSPRWVPDETRDLALV